MKVDKNNHTPLYYQLADLLREKIKKKFFNPGDPIPSESELLKDSSISRGTVRQALQILTREGLIERHPGRGSFVSHNKIEQDANRVMGFFTQAMLEAGKIPSAEILEVKEISATKLIRSKLQLSHKQPIVNIKRLRSANDVPLAIESANFINDVGRKLLNEDLRDSIYEILQDKYDYVIHRSENVIEASIADSETASLFGINKNSAIFVIHRLVFLADGNPFEYSEDIYRADRIKFSIEDYYQKGKTEFTIKARINEDIIV